MNARAPRPRIAVVTFPGSNDDRDAVHALDLLGADGTPVWHADEEVPDVDAVVLPGGFSYGDYLRCGAIARFAPVMAAVRAFAADGGPVLGICNGFQILCEAGMLPGVLRPNASLSFVCRDVPTIVENAETPFTSRCERGRRLVIPVKHGEGCSTHPDPGELEASGQIVLRYEPGANPNGSTADVAGVDQRGGERDGPDASPRARRRPAARLDGRLPHPGLVRRRSPRPAGRFRVAPFRRNAAASSGCSANSSRSRPRSPTCMVTGPRRTPRVQWSRRRAGRAGPGLRLEQLHVRRERARPRRPLRTTTSSRSSAFPHGVAFFVAMLRR